MARQTRAQRRARRAQMAPGSEAAIPGRPPAPPRRPTARAGAQPEPSREPRREPRSLPGGGTRRFIGESWGELKKVEWPTQNQLIQGVVVVLIACVIVGVYLWGADLVFKRLVQNVLLG
jgi:preprotein translocase subunit SecE